MPQRLTIKTSVPLSEQPNIFGMNRWHPAIPPVASLKPGEDIILETLDFLDGQIKNDDNPEDVRKVDLTRAHPLTGPIYIEGAEVGDLLVVDILDIGPITPYGFSGIFAKENGGGVFN